MQLVKRSLALILSLVMTVGSVPWAAIPVRAEETEETLSTETAETTVPWEETEATVGTSATSEAETETTVAVPAETQDEVETEPVQTQSETAVPPETEAEILVLGEAEQAANDNRAAVLEVGLKKPVTVTVTEAADAPVLLFTAPEENYYFVRMESSSEVWYQLYSELDADNSFSEMLLDAGEACYIKTGFQDNSETGAYTVTIEAAPDLVVGKSVSGSVTYEDYAYFRFVAPEENIYSFWSSASDVWYSVYDSNMEYRENDQEPMKPGEIYYVQAGFDEDKEGTLTLNTRSAAELMVGKTVSSAVKKAGEYAFYRFVAPEDNYYLIRVETSGAGIAVGDCGMDSVFAEALKAGEVCYLCTWFEDSDRTGNISVSIKAAPDLSVGKTSSATVQTPGGYAYFRFVSPKDDIYKFQTVGSDPVIMEVINLDWEYFGTDEPMEAGQICFAAVAFEDEEKTGTIRMKVTGTSALEPGETASGSVVDGDDRAWFHFTAPETGAYLFRTTSKESVWAWAYNGAMDCVNYGELPLAVVFSEGETYYLESCFTEYEGADSFDIRAEKCPEFPEAGEAEILLSGPDDPAVLSFTAPYDHAYTFRTDFSWCNLWLVDSCGEYLDGEESNEENGYTYDLKAGETYVLYVQLIDEGEAGTYTVEYEIHHSYKETILVPASCTEGGLLGLNCTECGHYEEEQIPAAHSFRDGVCENCQIPIADTLPRLYMDAYTELRIRKPGTSVMAVFTPMLTAEYGFGDSSDYETVGCLYNSAMEPIGEYDGWEYYELKAGEDYILEVYFADSNRQGTIPVVVDCEHWIFDSIVLPETGCEEAMVEAGDNAYLTFVPAYDHQYRFYAVSEDLDTKASLYDHDWEFVIGGDDGAGGSMDFDMRTWLEAGKLYILEAGIYGVSQDCCFDVYVEPIHSNRETVIKAPSCTKSGLAKHTCTICGHEEDVVLEPAHQYVDGVCTGCKTVYKQVLQEGYNYSEYPGKGEVKTFYFTYTPEYTEEYIISTYMGRDTVGYLYDAGNRLLTWDDDSSGDEIGFQITYTLQAGKTYTLAVEMENGSPVTWLYVDVQINHAFSVTEEKPATCEEDGYQIRCCDICGVVEEKNLYADHVWGTWEILDPGTCEEDGEKVRSCTRCGETETRTIFSKGHEFGESGVCNVCGQEMACSGMAGELTWTLDNTGILTISGTGPMPDYSRSSYYGETAPWDAYEDAIAAVVIEEGITAVGSYAFCYFSRLTDVVLPETLTTIRTDAFYSCTALEQLRIPAAVEALEPNAFEGCYSLADIRISEDNAVYVSNDQGMVLSKDGTTLYLVPVGSGSNVTIPDGVERIASCAFVERVYSDQIANVVFPESIQELENYVFGESLEFEAILQFTGDAPVFGEEAFEGSGYSSSAVNGIVLYPENNDTWTEDVLQNYGGYPEWKAYGGDLIASGTLMNIRWSLDNAGVLTVSGSGRMPDFADYYGEEPRDDVVIAECPWMEYRGLIREVVIEEGITRIGIEAFKECRNLVAVTIPDSVTGICEYAFQWCVSLEAVTLPEGLKLLGGGAFDTCESLTAVEIPAGVESFGWNIFMDCKNLTDVTLPDTLTVIPDTMFGRCISLRSIDIPETVTTIESAAFSGCTALESIVLPDGITEVADWAFKGCENLSQINLPDGITYIGSNAFLNCAKLTEIDLPENLRTIGHKAFYGCSGLTELEIPASVKKIHWGAFAYCTGLTEVVIPDGIGYLGGTFWGCTNLERVQIPDSVTKITYWTFKDCTSLPKVDMPTYLQSIGYNVFSGSGVEEVNFLGDAPAFAVDDAQPMWSDTERGTFGDAELTAYYPYNNTTWTEEIFAGDYGGKVTWEPKAYLEEVVDIQSEKLVLAAGEKTVLTAKLSPRLRKADVVWTLPEDAESCSQWSVNGDKLTITSKAVTEKRTLTVQAKTKEGERAPERIELTILPRAELVSIFQGTKLITGQKVPFDLNQEERTLQLTAQILPMDAGQKVAWKSSNEKVATVDRNGLVTFSGQKGTAKITVNAVDGSRKNASVTLEALVVPKNLELTNLTGDSERIDVVGGKTVALKVLDKDTGKFLTAKQITWTMDADYDAFASITTSGSLKTKKVATRTTVEVVGTITGSRDASVVYTVDIYPAATMVLIVDDQGDLVTGKTINMAGDAMCLEAGTIPLDGLGEITWKNPDEKKMAYAQYETNAHGDIEIHHPTGKAGVLTLKAVANDGSGKSATVKIQFGTLTESITIREDLPMTLRSGETMKLEAAAYPEKVSRAGIVWSLADNADSAYVTLTGNSLKAKTVYENHRVTVNADSKDGNASDSISILVMPKEEQSLVIKSGGTYLTGRTQALDPNGRTTLDLSAWMLVNPESGEIAENPQSVTWTSSNPAIASVSAENGQETTVTIHKTGTVTITAEGPGGRKAKLAVKGTTLVNSLTIRTVDGKNMQGKDILIASGKSLNLKAEVNGNASSKKVEWYVAEGDDLVSITTSGKLTAAAGLLLNGTAKIRAVAADGSGVTEEVNVWVYPAATGMEVFTVENGVQTFTRRSVDSWWVRNSTTAEWDMSHQGDIVPMGVRVYPYFADIAEHRALQLVSWKSSSVKVADFLRDESGQLILDEEGCAQLLCKSTGSTTITVTAQDGSNQKVSFKLNVVKNVYDFHMDSQVLGSGKSLNLAKLLQINEGSGTTTKKLTWAITGGNGAAYATLSGTGTLKAKPVTAHKQVEVTVTAQDTLGWSETFVVDLYPVTTKVLTKADGKDVTGKTLPLAAGGTLQLTADCQPAGAAGKYTWKSSNEKLVTVDETGLVKVQGTSGTVIITCTASDGSAQKATVKIKIG